MKKLFLTVSEYLQKNNCVWDFISCRLQACNFVKKREMFSCGEIFPKHVFWRMSAYAYFWTDFTKWLFGTLFLENLFQNHLDSAILQKYQLLSNQSFKHNSAHMPSLHLAPSFLLNLGFVSLSSKVKTPKVNACSSPLTPCWIKFNRYMF